MINEDKENPSWPSFLIDLDLAIREQRVDVSGATGKTGTRPFVAIGVLGEKHSSGCSFGFASTARRQARDELFHGLTSGTLWI